MLKKFLIGTIVAAAFMFVGALTASADCSITTTLKVGSTGSEVTCLQTKVGATADGVFGPMTKASVMAYQASHGLSADGVVGPLSRAVLNGAISGNFPVGCTSASGFSSVTGLACVAVPSSTAGCASGAAFSSTTGLSCTSVIAGCSAGAAFSSTTGASCTTGAVATGGTSGVGTVDTYSLISSLSSEKVGEGLNDVKVYGMDIEVGAGSDISLTAVKLVFNESTGATSNFKDYADEVSVWLGSTKLATIDSDKFTDDNDWTYTVGLPNAKILAGATGKLYVAVSAVGNLDTGDSTDTWTLDVTSIRWVDGQGAMISEDPTLATRSFTFELSAVATNTEFKISGDVATVNDAHVIDIHATDDTQGVSILSFKVKVEGTSDIMLKDLPVFLTVGGAQDNVDEMVSGLTLWMDGAEVASSNLAVDCNVTGSANPDADCVAVGTTETYAFHDIDTELNAGQTYHFLVKADIFGITDTGDVVAGDTVAARFGEVETQLADFDAELGGTNLIDADKTGTVTGSASIVRDSGINVALVNTTATVALGASGQPDIGTTTITFDVTAFGADMYIDGTSPVVGGANASSLVINGPGGASTQASVITSSTGAVRTGDINTTARFLVSEGETERFTITSTVTPVGTAGFHSISLTSLAYDDADIDLVDATNIEYVTGLSTFVSPSISLKLTN